MSEGYGNEKVDQKWVLVQKKVGFLLFLLLL